MNIIVNSQNHPTHHLKALSPAVQEEVEKNAIANDPTVKKLLEEKGVDITDIFKMPVIFDDRNESEYIVRTNGDYIIRVHVFHKPDGTLGPVKFELVVKEPEILEKHVTGIVILPPYLLDPPEALGDIFKN